jgi:hypothetical protein
MASPELAHGESRPQPDVRLGLFDILYPETASGGARFLVVGSGQSGPSGFAYAPGGLPASEAAYDCALGGDWYVWSPGA